MLSATLSEKSVRSVGRAESADTMCEWIVANQ